MFNKSVLVLLLIFFSLSAFSQNCKLNIIGIVKDAISLKPIEGVNIQTETLSNGTNTDEKGSFKLIGLCVGNYNLNISHLCCETEVRSIQLTSDTSITIYLNPSTKLLNDILIIGKKNKPTLQNSQSINVQNITDNSNQNLSNLLEQINGVRILRNGNGISKPIVHGLYGNRLMILNNGITQSGQQWGNDHSPEIDPLIANQITVVKGTAAIQYMGSSLGSVVLIEPKKIVRETELNGSATLFFETNGLGNGINLQLQQYSSVLAWKINSTLKKSGDKNTPSYYLTNTGHQEANIAIQLEKILFKNWYTDLYFSSFNTKLGVLRGSHIGNVTDLEEAFTRDIPFFTNVHFSYNIAEPKQKVNHQLLKLHSKYFITDSQWIDLTISAQLNDRKEFDVRRSNLKDTPALSIIQYSYYGEFKHEINFKNNLNLKSGLQFNVTDNTNRPETGILPLIPDYRSFQSGLFVLATKKIGKSSLDLGLRFDYITQNVLQISNTVPREIIRHQQIFGNFNGSLGWSHDLNNILTITSNLGYAVRNPGINEFFSGGLHQGVSGIEEGNISLHSEKSIKSTLGIKTASNDMFALESLVYFQSIQDYIFLKPKDEIRLTIRGAFPVFNYAQTNAQIYGFDFRSSIEIFQNLKFNLSFSFIKGSDISGNLPLINMPANNFASSFDYNFKKSIQIGKVKLNNSSLQLNSSIVFRQNNLFPQQDYILPPDGYHLLGLKMSTEIPFSKYSIRFTTRVDNILNTKFRDYLNRQRYFADDLGRNISFVLNIQF